MERQGTLAGVSLERLHAVEAGNISDADFARLSRQWERPITRIELACFLSHRALWQRAATSTEGLVILEDDSVLSPRFSSTLGRLPQGFDLINLETVGRRKFFARKPSFLGDGFQVTRLLREKSGAGAYFLSPAGARKLLARAEAHVAPVDAFMFGVAKLRIGQVEPALTMQVHLLAERGIDAGMTTTTSIHQPREKLAWTAANLGFHGRRAATQLRLAAVQLRRLWDGEFRRPAFDEDEFRQILPIRMDVAGDGAAAQDRQSRS